MFDPRPNPVPLSEAAKPMGVRLEPSVCKLTAVWLTDGYREFRIEGKNGCIPEAFLRQGYSIAWVEYEQIFVNDGQWAAISKILGETNEEPKTEGN